MTPTDEARARRVVMTPHAAQLKTSKTFLEERSASQPQSGDVPDIKRDCANDIWPSLLNGD
jgi:hypothetical protein